MSRVQGAHPHQTFPSSRRKKREKKNRKENETQMKGEEEEELSSGRRSNEYGQLDESLESRSSLVLLHMC